MKATQLLTTGEDREKKANATPQITVLGKRLAEEEEGCCRRKFKCNWRVINVLARVGKCSGVHLFT